MDAEGVLRGKGALPVASYRLAATIAAPPERRPAPASGWADDDNEGARDRPVQVQALPKPACPEAGGGAEPGLIDPAGHPALI